MEWHETKVGVFYRQEQAAQSSSGRGQLCEKVVVSWQGAALELGRRLHWQAQAGGLGRARQTLVVGDGAPWIWNLAADRWPAAHLATYVELTAGGEETKILSAGMDVRSPRSPASIPAQVANLALTAGDDSGELDLQWDPVDGVRSYEVQLGPDPMTATSWVSKPTVTNSKTTATGQTSGARMWARVRAVNSAGPGAWSDPATKIVP